MRFDCVRRQPNARPPTGELATASQRNFRIVESAYPSEHPEIDKLAFMRYKHVLQKCKEQRCPKRSAITRFVAWINSRAQSAPCICVYERRRYSGRPSSSMRFSEATAMATSVVCRPLVRERSASPITRL